MLVIGIPSQVLSDYVVYQPAGLHNYFDFGSIGLKAYLQPYFCGSLTLTLWEIDLGILGGCFA